MARRSLRCCRSGAEFFCSTARTVHVVTGLVDLATQGAPLFRGHARATTAVVGLRLLLRWLILRLLLRLRLLLVLRRQRLHGAHVALPILTLCLALLPHVFAIVSAPITVASKRTAGSKCQCQCNAYTAG